MISDCSEQNKKIDVTISPKCNQYSTGRDILKGTGEFTSKDWFDKVKNSVGKVNMSVKGEINKGISLRSWILRLFSDICR